MIAKFLVEAGELALGLIQRPRACRYDELFLVFDPLTMIEHRLQAEIETLHVMLINFASVCSGELAS